MKHLLKHPSDQLAVLIIVLFFSIQLSAVLFTDNVWVLLAVVVTMTSLSAFPGSISHNHFHRNTFKRAWLNRAYEQLLFLETGIPPFGWTLHHNLGHHKHYLSQKDDPSAWMKPDGSVMGRVYYDVYNSLRIYPEIHRIGQQFPNIYSRFKKGLVLGLVLLTILFLINPIGTLIVFILPMPILLLGLLDNTYHQHQGLDISSDYTASRNTLNKLYNFVTFNLGYHTAHHMFPSVHWSELPEKHEEIKANIPEYLIGNSIFLSRAPKIVRETIEQVIEESKELAPSLNQGLSSVAEQSNIKNKEKDLAEEC